ncbi:MAG: N-acetylmuramoyl-L-alanine amidase [Pseudohongiellaceae bacterium]|jgi:N-acetylmuramoyl-L-alanine amidase
MQFNAFFSAIILLAVMLFSGVSMAGQASVTNARLWDAPDHSRLVLELSKAVEHKVLILSNPHRLVLDIKNATKKTRFDALDFIKSPVKSVRSARRNKQDLRIVLDLKEKVKPKSFLLKANDQYGDRLVIDLYSQSKKQTIKKKRQAKTVENSTSQKRDIIIMIDPGHGGEDPGAMGPNRIKEKDVVLAIAKDLKNLVNAQKGYKAYLTRSSDYYVGLRKRTDLARKYETDLFVSIHADAFIEPQANGASVYALSNRGASSETARWLAQKENSADLMGGVGGVSLDGKDNILAGVLLDLSSTASLKASLSVGDRVLRSMGGFARLHKHQVQQAGFVVLKSPDIPSILVETGFISNPKESRRLKTRKYQKQLAKAIHKGVARYFENSPPPGSLIAWQKTTANKFAKYVVKKGDTLSHIAMRNDVSVKSLRELNRLRSDNVWIGQRLSVPAS